MGKINGKITNPVLVVGEVVVKLTYRLIQI
jgi:hypothetical protein